ncbi:MAG TPA: ABC transporter substrate-binding protein, partial [Opitutales bacterium]|nr:ABC transporter substrate-binding protein [Opitutales bacterium]
MTFRPAFKPAPVLPAIWLCLAFCLTACEGPPRVERGEHELPEDVEVVDWEPGSYGGIFVLNEISQPTTFNPQVPNDRTTSQILSYMLSALVGFDPRSSEFVPDLTKSWEVSEDKRSYTFHLRKGLRWSDGTPFTADDVIFT